MKTEGGGKGGNKEARVKSDGPGWGAAGWLLIQTHNAQACTQARTPFQTGAVPMQGKENTRSERASERAASASGCAGPLRFQRQREQRPGIAKSPGPLVVCQLGAQMPVQPVRGEEWIDLGKVSGAQDGRGGERTDEIVRSWRWRCCHSLTANKGAFLVLHCHEPGLIV